MSKRNKVKAHYEQAYANFMNESAKTYSANSRISTSKYMKPVNVHQKQFVKSMKQNQLTIGSGCAGTGKTVLALFTGIQLINNPDSPIDKLIYIRANVDDREERDIGALPGDLIEKVRHLAYPILDNLELFMETQTIDYLLEESRIEVLPFLMMRGRSFNNTFIIVDEAQNATPKQMKTVLTRCSETSKMVIIGDPRQCDIDPLKNGLQDLEWRMIRTIEQCQKNDTELPLDIGLIHFTREDIVRSYLTRFILEMYDIS